MNHKLGHIESFSRTLLIFLNNLTATAKISCFVVAFFPVAFRWEFKGIELF